MKNIFFLCTILAIFLSCQQALETDTQGVSYEDNWNRDSQKEPEPEPEPELLYLPSSIEMLAKMSEDIFNSGGRITRWQYNEEARPLLVMQLRKMEALAAYQLCNQYEYAYLVDIREDKNENGELGAAVYIDALREEYSFPAVNTFPAQNATVPIIIELTNSLRQNEISVVSEILPTAANGNTHYTITYTSKDWNLIRSLETISAVFNKYPLWVKSLDISINGDNSRFTVMCSLAYCDTQHTTLLGAEKEKIPAAFDYKEPEPPPDPVLLPPSIEILEKVSTDILNAGGKITRWQSGEDSDPFMIMQIQGIGVQSVYGICDQYKYANLQDIREGSNDGEPNVTVYMNALRADYAAPPLAAFPSQSRAISIISDLKNKLQSEAVISIVSEVMPTAANDNAYYTITYTSNNQNLINSLTSIAGICSASKLRIKNLDVSINSSRDQFTVVCSLSYIDKQLAINAGNDIYNIPLAFGYKEPEPPIVREMTIIIYMAADNDLESAAIADFNEMEAVKNLDRAPFTILVLLDRHPAYDQTNGNWSDTRLFEVKSDPDGLNSTIISTRLDCPELGLSKNTETELNTADPLVLSKLIDFAKREYPANQYALIVWGHGTGWRSSPDAESKIAPNKAVAFDDTHGQYMSLPAFGRAVAGKGLYFIGFDTCYAALIEVAYQLKNSAYILVGSEGAIPSTGWDYTALFNFLLPYTNPTVNALANSALNQFSFQYAALNNATISQIYLGYGTFEHLLYKNFNDFARLAALAIKTQETRDRVLNEILHNVKSYYSTSYPSDLYVDIRDLYLKIAPLVGITITPSDSLLMDLDYSVVSWSNDGTPYSDETPRIGIHFCTLLGPGVPAPRHEDAYIRGSMVMEKGAFVEAQDNYWAPNTIPRSDSLLDKLFYWNDWEE